MKSLYKIYMFCQNRLKTKETIMSLSEIETINYKNYHTVRVWVNVLLGIC